MWALTSNCGACLHVQVSNHVMLQRFMRHTLAIPLPDDCSAGSSDLAPPPSLRDGGVVAHSVCGWVRARAVERLADGEASAVLGLVWALALHYQFRALRPAASLSSSSGVVVSPRERNSSVDVVRRALLDKLTRFLAREDTPHERAPPVASNFQQDWSDGTLFSALIHRYRRYHFLLVAVIHRLLKALWRWWVLVVLVAGAGGGTIGNVRRCWRWRGWTQRTSGAT